jgi:hypothetical protein
MALCLTAAPILHFTTATRLALSISTFKDQLSQILSTSLSISFHFRIHPSCQRHAYIFLHFFPHNLLLSYYVSSNPHVSCRISCKIYTLKWISSASNKNTLDIYPNGKSTLGRTTSWK